MKIIESPKFNRQVYDAQPHLKQARRDWKKTPNGKKNKKRYRHDNGMYITNTKYLSRKIVAIDGEGVNRGSSHLYVLLAISGKEPIYNDHGLTTIEILDYLYNNLKPEDLNVIYGGSYDFNFWVRDLPEDQLHYLYHSNFTQKPLEIGDYWIRWMRGKGFEIGKNTGKPIKIYDVISFFQTSFINACDQYLGEYNGRDVLVKEKARRGQFTLAEMRNNVTEYNNLELELLVELVTELRARLNKVNLRPRNWYGPGAIAHTLFTREKIKKSLDRNVPKKVAEAARYAYAGGRFELVKYGQVTTPSYAYDINSAYPFALTKIPNLADGRWIHHRKPTDKEYEFALYRVVFNGHNPKIPAPLFFRAKNGSVSFPLNVSNWVWSPEFAMLKKYCQKVPNTKYQVIECYEFRPNTSEKPFNFIHKLYTKRLKLKSEGDGAQLGIKLALNSCYGKLAQQVGWVPETEKHPLRIPPFHQLEIAGFVTSHTRAQILESCLDKLENVIAFETDAVFTNAPLDLPISDQLGEFDSKTFASLTYVQSGHYYATDSDGKEIVKCRGIDKGFISRANIENQLAKPETERIYPAELTRFYGAGVALKRGLDEWWCKWVTEKKELTLMPTGKRVHADCDCDTTKLERDRWHETICPYFGGVSAQYPVEWINPDPNMSELTDFREDENLYED